MARKLKMRPGQRVEVTMEWLDGRSDAYQTKLVGSPRDLALYRFAKDPEVEEVTISPVSEQSKAEVESFTLRTGPVADGLITVAVEHGGRMYTVFFPTRDTDDTTVSPTPGDPDEEGYTDRWWEIVSAGIDKLAAVVRFDRERT